MIAASNEYIKFEVWEDNWWFKPAFEVDLSLLTEMDFYPWTRKKNYANLIRLEIADNDQPTLQQVNTLQFIITHQQQIRHGIFDYYQKVILPVFREATDIEEEEIANNEKELAKVFGFKGIDILSRPDSNIHYYFVQFDFNYDNEHGLCLLFQDDKVIDLSSEDDKDEKAISIYEGRLNNQNGEPLNINVYFLNGELLFKGNYHLNDTIHFAVKKGTYRSFITHNQSQFCRNFHVPHDLESFSLQQLLTMS